jgi:outer membrane lipoprotein-sorting protein
VREFGIKRIFYLPLLLLLLFIMTGCGGPEPMPADQVISKAASAIQSASSFHFTFEASKPDKPQPGLFVSEADGTVAKPDKLSGSVNATFGGLPVNLKVVVDGQSQYITDPVSGSWTKASAALNVTQYFDPSKGASDILGKIKDPRSDGTESVGGVDCYRIKGTVPASALQAISGEVSATADLNTTLWVGASDFLMRKVQLDGPLATGEPASMSRTITFSDYNKDVKIETPVVAP